MPNYDYECPKCNLVTEVTHPMLISVVICNKCKYPMKKLVTGGAFHLKGDGWPGKEIKEERKKQNANSNV